MLDTQKSHHEYSKVYHTVQHPDLRVRRILICLGKLASFRVGEGRIQEEASSEKSTEEYDEGHFHW